MSARGYVVRGTDDDGEAWATYERASVSGWRTHTAATESRRDATLFETPDEAARSAADFRERFTGVTIFAVAEDGTESPLPTYEEALQRSQDVASILTDGVPAIMRSSAPATREQIGAAACQMLKAIERALSVLRGERGGSCGRPPRGPRSRGAPAAGCGRVDGASDAQR